MNKKSQIKNLNKGDSKESLLHSTIDLTIEKIIVGGEGLGRFNGAVIFVPNSVPGDQLKVKVVDDQKNFYRAEIIKIIQPSKDRINPECPVALECGGCNLQQMNQNMQLAQKMDILNDLFRKFLPNLTVKINPIIPSPLSFRYRNRIQPKIDGSRLGFYKKNSHEIIPFSDCLITEQKLIHYINDNKDIVLKEFKDFNKINRVEFWLDSELNPNWSFANESEETDGFAQVNRFQNVDLISYTINLCKLNSIKTALDLYSGGGNFTFPLFKELGLTKITGVELNPKLVKKAVNLIPKTQNKNINFYNSSVGNFLNRHQVTEDLVLLDPPRSGCEESTIRALAFSSAKKIIYISCHPVSLVRDLRRYFDFQDSSKNTKLKIKSIQPFEMFPQTDHFETIVELGID